MGSSTDTADDTGTDTGTDGGFVAITTQAEFDKAVARVLAPKLQRERAKFADYDELKAKAAQFDAATQAAKTAEQQTAERLGALEEKLTNSELRALRLEVAADAGLPKGYHEFLTGTDQETLAEQAQKLLGLGKDQLSKGGTVRKEGSTKVPDKTDPKREWLRSLSEGQDAD